MTIQQLEYILAVDQFRHFARAAEYCRVTQPTLSAMIQKLEDELGVKLFDRTVQPVCPTPIGQKVIDQARVILAQAAQVKEIISEDKQSLSGVFRLGVLPTIAPYLLPRFFPQLMEKYPDKNEFGRGRENRGTTSVCRPLTGTASRVRPTEMGYTPAFVTLARGTAY